MSGHALLLGPPLKLWDMEGLTQTCFQMRLRDNLSFARVTHATVRAARNARSRVLGGSSQKQTGLPGEQQDLPILGSDLLVP